MKGRAVLGVGLMNSLVGCRREIWGDGICGGTPCLQALAPPAYLGILEEEREGRDDWRCCKHATVPGISMPGKRGYADNDASADDEFQERVEVVHPVECFVG